MQAAPIPSNELDRLTALRRLLILDTSPEQRFDRIVQFSRDEFDVPIALISLVDSNRQWFKSKIGLDVCETPREISFCGHAILSARPLIIQDALTDERFFDNPLVTGDPHIRFYAGAPIQSGGHNIGTLCILDRKPRVFDAIDAGILQSLAELATAELSEKVG